MLTKHELVNNVRTTIAGAGITAASTSVIVNKTSAPYKDPPQPSSAADATRGVITFMDSLSNPTKIEIVYYLGWADNGDGTITLSGLQRGREDTIASAFSAGQYAVQMLTAGELATKLLSVNHGEGRVDCAGNGLPNTPALWVHSGGIRVTLNDSIQNALSMGLPEYSKFEYLWSWTGTPDDCMLMVTHPSDRTGGQPAIRTTFNNYADGTKLSVVMQNTVIEQIELMRVTRWWPRTSGSLASNTTIDWATNDIVRMPLVSNTTLAFTDSSDFILPDGAYRRLTLIIEIPAVINPGFTVALPASVLIPAGVSAPLFNSGSNQIRVLEFLYEGNYFLYEGMRTYQLA